MAKTVEMEQNSDCSEEEDKENKRNKEKLNIFYNIKYFNTDIIN